MQAQAERDSRVRRPKAIGAGAVVPRGGASGCSSRGFFAGGAPGFGSASLKKQCGSGIAGRCSIARLGKTAVLSFTGSLKMFVAPGAPRCCGKFRGLIAQRPGDWGEYSRDSIPVALILTTPFLAYV